jgi:hypothetical protein
VIDAEGYVALFRSDPTEIWHVLERRDGLTLVANCGILMTELTVEQRRTRVDQVIQVGRTCLQCAEVVAKAL